MVSDRRPTETELDRRIRRITERVERDHRTWPTPPARLCLSWKGHLVACLSTIVAGFSGYFVSEFLQSKPLYKQSIQICEPLGGPPTWLVSLTVAFGMACLFYFFTKLLLVEDFAWARR